MKKQKVVLGTDDKHVYFKMQNRKQAVRFAKCFVYMCVCNVFDQLFTLCFVFILVYCDACPATLHSTLILLGICDL